MSLGELVAERQKVDPLNLNWIMPALGKWIKEVINPPFD